MIDIREFIKNLGDSAPAYFDTKPETIKRWVKTGNVPIKVAQKIYAAAEAVGKSAAPAPAPAVPVIAPTPEDNIDPFTHLPRNIDKRLPEIQVMAGGRLPDTIEMNPNEQSFGNNLTRPGRVNIKPLPPMKIREEGGQKIAYVDTSPKTPTAIPPSIGGGTDWATAKPNEPATAKTEVVSPKTV